MNSDPPGYHEDAELFGAALSFTQSDSGFTARLIEKDYYCSLLLKGLVAAATPQWAFKGGTCLSKVHSDFYRMSEDLDFAYSVAAEAPRSRRSAMVAPMKEHFAKLPKRLACFTVVDMLRGYNNSTQYIGQLSYRSSVTGQDEPVKVEFSIRETILEPMEALPARTLLSDPFRLTAAVPPFPVPVLSHREAYAEKLRAALTRGEPAVRDFYDIDHGVRSGGLDTTDPRLIELVAKKLAVAGNDPIDVSQGKYDALGRQTRGQLRPVLRETDFSAFDLARAFAIVTDIARALR
ncbi:MAG: nucleotidyl transferase AbiEii/AbiGii toxin family protein [Planctomycetes bacterium]|nr:nucleotidyl transferase AbiEii/AbiGii toxin family protein [Planctomycetota bacterium]